jgi:hypothetical protein
MWVIMRQSTTLCIVAFAALSTFAGCSAPAADDEATGESSNAISGSPTKEDLDGYWDALEKAYEDAPASALVELKDGTGLPSFPASAYAEASQICDDIVTAHRWKLNWYNAPSDTKLSPRTLYVIDVTEGDGLHRMRGAAIYDENGVYLATHFDGGEGSHGKYGPKLDTRGWMVKEFCRAY